MRLSAIISEADPLTDGEGRLLSHMLARCGLPDGLRVLGLMDRLGMGQDAAGMDLLSWAARGGDEACMLLAGEVCGAGRRDRWGGGALHHWAESKGGGIGAGAQILLALGVDPASGDNWGLLPMHWSRDPGVWAWSMAALWSRGKPNRWMQCGGVGYREACRRLENEGFVDWVERSKSARRATLGGERRPRAEAWPSEREWRSQMSERRAALGKMEAEQNCIAKKLGIELSDGFKRPS